MKSTRRIILITAISFWGGGIFYALWLVVFLVLFKIDGAIVQMLLWLLSPLVTALGFTLAVLVTNRILKEKKTSFLSIYFWPFAGCFLGAILVYWYGPMLIVFSMLAAGTLSVFLREVRLARINITLVE
jgi:hypothetical protein